MMLPTSAGRRGVEMYDFAAMGEWLRFAVHWTHVIAAIAWIGSSFYFIALDLGLRRGPELKGLADGEEWQVHGGGFYHIQKYMVAPEAMPEHLTWFKFEAYFTWLSGFVLMALLYYGGATIYLIDPAVMALSPGVAIAISVASIAFGWIAYDLICKTKFGDDNTRLMILLYCILVAMAWGYTQVFSGRAALLHLGAFTATIMSANVFFIIIPNQKIVVEDLKAGRAPDPKYGKVAKQRSTHNNYLTLPVLFLMLSNHYPLSFATEYNWVIASLIFLVGVLIRHFFNSMHSRKGEPYWTWFVAALLFIFIAWMSTAPMFRAAEGDAVSAMPSAVVERFAAAPHFEEARDAVLGRCAMCHAAEPTYEGFHWAPRGVLLETDAQIAAQARQIYMQAGLSHAMPPANVSFMEPEERRLIIAWYKAATAR